MSFIFLWIIIFMGTCPADGVTCSCGRFSDDNGNGICDQSINEVSNSKDNKNKSNLAQNLSQKDSQNSNHHHHKGCTHAQNSENSVKNSNNNQKQQSNQTENQRKFRKFNYYLTEISSITIILYILSLLLVKFKVINRGKYKKFWNFTLLFSFLISAITGLLLVVEVNYGIRFIFPFKMLFWHVTTGVPAMIIGLIHIFWHWRYFIKALKS